MILVFILTVLLVIGTFYGGRLRAYADCSECDLALGVIRLLTCLAMEGKGHSLQIEALALESPV